MVQTIGRCHVPPTERMLKRSLFGNMTKGIKVYLKIKDPKCDDK